MTRALATDWADWASTCEQRATVEPPAPTEVALTFSVMGREVDHMRVDLATGSELLANVVPLFG